MNQAFNNRSVALLPCLVSLFSPIFSNPSFSQSLTLNMKYIPPYAIRNNNALLNVIFETWKLFYETVPLAPSLLREQGGTCRLPRWPYRCQKSWEDPSNIGSSRRGRQSLRKALCTDHGPRVPEEINAPTGQCPRQISLILLLAYSPCYPYV